MEIKKRLSDASIWALKMLLITCVIVFVISSVGVATLHCLDMIFLKSQILQGCWLLAIVWFLFYLVVNLMLNIGRN